MLQVAKCRPNLQIFASIDRFSSNLTNFWPCFWNMPTYFHTCWPYPQTICLQVPFLTSLRVYFLRHDSSLFLSFPKRSQLLSSFVQIDTDRRKVTIFGAKLSCQTHFLWIRAPFMHLILVLHKNHRSLISCLHLKILGLLDCWRFQGWHFLPCQNLSLPSNSASNWSWSEVV